MPFSREKDLWRYASKNLSPLANGTNSQLQQQRPHPLRRLPQMQQNDSHRDHYQQQQKPYTHQLQAPSSGSSYDSSLPKTHYLTSNQQISNTPVSSYSSVPCGIKSNDSSAIQKDCLLAIERPQFQLEQNSTVLTAGTESSETSTQVSSTGGYKRESSGDDIFASNYGPPRTKGKNTSRLENPLKYSQRSLRSGMQTTTAGNTITTIATMIRNFCSSASCTDSNSSIAATTAMNEQICGNEITFTVPSMQSQTPRNYFRKLMKMMKSEQKNDLLEAVKSRVDSGGVPKSRCILLPRSPIFGQLPHVVACCLFFWSDLRDETELKPLPICPCDCDPVYVCCNPLHWCRIIEAETAPPPYQDIGMERLKHEGEESEVEGYPIIASTGSSNASTRKAKMSDIYANFPKSFTTQSEEGKAWCQVSYWELNKRVGKQFYVQKPRISIYTDGSCGNEYTEEICLENLAALTVRSTTIDVQHTRQKIGLGIILSQEKDGVWLYNRCASPIFVLSPSISENLSPTCVCRVTPGSCLKAFDYQRAQSLMYSARSCSTEVGPINTYSLCISFVKGWGDSFKRQNIMTCPCWLEIHFTQR